MTKPGGREKLVCSVALPASDDVMSMVLDRTTDGVLLANADGTIVYVNKPLLELFGYRKYQPLPATAENLASDLAEFCGQKPAAVFEDANLFASDTPRMGLLPSPRLARSSSGMTIHMT